MTDESRGSPLPQRERGATEAGARPAPARVGAPALPDDLRQRMQASVDAERAQNRERAAEMLRHPPQRLVGGERPDHRRGDAQDRKPNPLRKRFGKGDRTRTPETTPDNQAPIVDNGPPVNSPPAEFLSRTNVSPSAPPLSTPAARDTPHSGNTGLASPTGNAPASPASPASNADPASHAGPGSYTSPAGNTGLASNIGRAQPVSPLPPSSRPPTAGVDLFTPPVGSPSAPAPAPGPDELPPGHPSGPSATSSAQAPPAPPAPRAQARPSTPPAPPAPAVTPTARGSRRRWAKLGLVAGVLAVLAAGSAGLIVATSGSKSPKAVVVGPVQQAAVAAWVDGQIDPATVVSCDPAMCAALVAHHYPSKNVRDLSSPSALKASGVVVVTPVALQLFGSSLVTAWAPAALATFGSGSSTVSVRVVAPHGATAYEQAARKDQAVRALSEAALTGFKSITVTGAAAQELNSGQIDGRLFEALAAAAVPQPIDIVDFGNAGAGASADVPLRYADLAASNPAVGLSGPAYVQTLRTGMNGSPGPRPARTQLLTLPGGQQVLRVEYLGPSKFGVLGNS
jgi:hypothetical protein